MKKITLSLAGVFLVIGSSFAQLLERLSHIPAKANVVIDTDAFNEVDDQFALVYAILAQENLIFRPFIQPLLLINGRKAWKMVWKRVIKRFRRFWN